MQKREVRRECDVGWDHPKFLDDPVAQVQVIVLRVSDDQCPLIKAEPLNYQAGFSRSCDGKNYALIHSIASCMYFGAISSAAFLVSSSKATSALFFNMYS